MPVPFGGTVLKAQPETESGDAAMTDRKSHDNHTMLRDFNTCTAGVPAPPMGVRVQDSRTLRWNEPRDNGEPVTEYLIILRQ